MTQHPHLDPSPFFLEAGPVGVLLIHGFTGSPPEMRLLGDYLHDRGYTVSAPLLPGHGTRVEDMLRVKWTEWTVHAERALADLQGKCDVVFVAGLSMGALLTLYLAAHHPELPGAAVYSPATLIADRLIYLSPLAKYIVRTRPKGRHQDLTDPEADRRLWSYNENPAAAVHELLKLQLRVRRLLPRVTCPLLVVHSTGDPTIRADSAAYTYRRAGSTDKELVTLHHCGHCITVDSEWEAVAEKTAQFIEKHLPAAG